VVGKTEMLKFWKAFQVHHPARLRSLMSRNVLFTEFMNVAVYRILTMSHVIACLEDVHFITLWFNRGPFIPMVLPQILFNGTHGTSTGTFQWYPWYFHRYYSMIPMVPSFFEFQLYLHGLILNSFHGTFTG
jgi:hypothetical protein